MGGKPLPHPPSPKPPETRQPSQPANQLGRVGWSMASGGGGAKGPNPQAHYVVPTGHPKRAAGRDACGGWWWAGESRCGFRSKNRPFRLDRLAAAGGVGAMATGTTGRRRGKAGAARDWSPPPNQTAHALLVGDK